MLTGHSQSEAARLKVHEGRSHEGALSEFCTRCGAWRGELGSEPNPSLYVSNLVAVFREVRRVLHPSGVLVLNLGDSMSGSGKGPTGHNGIGDQAGRQGFTDGRPSSKRKPSTTQGPNVPASWSTRNSPERLLGVPGYKAKDLMQMPFKVAEALRADGWYLRSVMPWLKRSAMPESVTDRPSNALEWLFLFSKRARYYWDGDAIRSEYNPGSIGRYDSPMQGTAPNCRLPGGDVERRVRELGIKQPNPAGRAFRNTDPWFISLDAAIADARADLARLEAMRADGGVLTDSDGLPLAVDVNPQGFDGAHFATFAPNLVVPFVKAGTSERGACPRCLAPYSRVVERMARGGWHDHVDDGVVGQRQYGNDFKGTNFYANYVPPVSVGWAPSCACDAGEPIPATILDPFAGSGTTLMVASRLGRDGIGIELSESYAALARGRIDSDAPLFERAEVEGVAGEYAPLGLWEEAI